MNIAYLAFFFCFIRIGISTPFIAIYVNDTASLVQFDEHTEFLDPIIEIGPLPENLGYTQYDPYNHIYGVNIDDEPRMAFLFLEDEEQYGFNYTDVVDDSLSLVAHTYYSNGGQWLTLICDFENSNEAISADVYSIDTSTLEVSPNPIYTVTPGGENVFSQDFQSVAIVDEVNGILYVSTFADGGVGNIIGFDLFTGDLLEKYTISQGVDTMSLDSENIYVADNFNAVSSITISTGVVFNIASNWCDDGEGYTDDFTFDLVKRKAYSLGGCPTDEYIFTIDMDTGKVNATEKAPYFKFLYGIQTLTHL